MEDSGSARYLTPTFSSSLPAYTHGETERIKNSYRCGTHWTIKQLPASIEPGMVEAVRSKHIVDNVNIKPPRIYKAPVLSPTFGPIRYPYNEYSKESEIHRHDIEEDRVKIDCWSRKPFLASSRIKLRNEDIFENESYQFPTMGPGRDKVSFDSMLRKDVTDSSRFKAGPFNVATIKGKQGSCATVDNGIEFSRDEAHSWSQQLYTVLAKDWAHVRFTVRYTLQDEFVISFPVDLDDPDRIPEEAIGKYMTNLSKHGVGSKLQLRKRGDRWNVYEEVPIDTAAVEQTQTSPTNKADMNETAEETADILVIEDREEGADDEQELDAADALTDAPDNTEESKRDDSLNQTGNSEANDNIDNTMEVTFVGDHSAEQDTFFGDQLQSKRQLLLVYAFYAPWIKKGSQVVRRRCANKNRTTIHKMKHPVLLPLIPRPGGDTTNGMGTDVMPPSVSGDETNNSRKSSGRVNAAKAGGSVASGSTKQSLKQLKNFSYYDSH